MKRKRSSNKRQSNYQSLEHRRLLAVTVGSHDGHMWVQGDADGLVEVTAVGDQTFQVTENGVEIGTYENVSKNLRIRLDQSAAQNDELKIDLLDEAFENISINLGKGDNHTEISGTHRRGFDDSFYVQRLRIQGGNGNDTADVSLITNKSFVAQLGLGDDSVTLNSSTPFAEFRGGFGNDTFEVTEEGSSEHNGPKIGRIVGLMGPGADVLEIDAETYSSVDVFAGTGSDIVEFGANAVFTDTSVHLGHGDNEFTHRGWIAGDLRVLAGSGNDNITLAENSMGTNGAVIILGHGDNNVSLRGNLWGNTYIRGESGADDIHIGSDGEIRGDFIGVLSDGDNTLMNEATITDRLLGYSRNQFDTFADNGEVEGLVFLKPGGQSW